VTRKGKKKKLGEEKKSAQGVEEKLMKPTSLGRGGREGFTAYSFTWTAGHGNCGVGEKKEDS